jgi:hypothetical protein
VLKLGFTIAQSTVARHMYEGFAAIAGLADLSDQSCRWQAVDLCMLPTITFRLLSCLVILRHGRRLPIFVQGDDKPPRKAGSAGQVAV